MTEPSSDRVQIENLLRRALEQASCTFTCVRAGRYAERELLARSVGPLAIAPNWAK
jgi:hypothetical protein